MSQLLRALKTADDKRKASRRTPDSNYIDNDQSLVRDNSELDKVVQEGIANECELEPHATQETTLSDARAPQTSIKPRGIRNVLITAGLMLSLTIGIAYKLHISAIAPSNTEHPSDLVTMVETTEASDSNISPNPQLQLDKNFDRIASKRPNAEK